MRSGDIPPPGVDGARAGTSLLPPRPRPGVYLLHHTQALVSSLGRIWRAPLSSLLTASVLGIALALPAGLYVLLQSAEGLSEEWQGAPSISLFLQPGVAADRVGELAEQIAALASVEQVQIITPAEAMTEFRSLSGFNAALDALGTNPLPAVLVVEPRAGQLDPPSLQRLGETLSKLDEADFAQFDMQWIRRLHAVLGIAERGVLIIGALLALGVLLIVGNTIRLEIERRREEIVVVRLVGGTDAFIRRPFLYQGLWYGLLGGGLAWGMVSASLALLAQPVRTLALLYDSGFALAGLDSSGALALLGGGALLGLAGSRVAVARHMRRMEPV